VADVSIGQGNLAGKGAYANRDFKKGEIVIEYALKELSEAEFKNLPNAEKMFTHKHWNKIYLYAEPERYVNRSDNPNTYQDLKIKCDIALRDIKKGERITTNSNLDDIL